MNEITWLQGAPGLGARITNRLLRATRAKTPLDVATPDVLITARAKLDRIDAFGAALRRKASLPFVAQQATLAGVPVRELTVRQPLSPPDDGVLLFLHGGGFFFRSIHGHMLLAARIAQQAGIGRVVMPLYSLAPERHFPVAVEECHRVYVELLDSGVPADRIVVAADSAGAALAMGMLLRARDAGAALPRGLALLSPLIDLSYSGASIAANIERDPMFGGAAMPHPSYYLGQVDPRDPECSPLFADLTGLPPLYVQVGSTERLLDDSIRLADAARSHGVSVAVEVWRDMPHVFQVFDFKEAARARQQIARFFRQA